MGIRVDLNQRDESMIDVYTADAEDIFVWSSLPTDFFSWADEKVYNGLINGDGPCRNRNQSKRRMG